CRMRGPPARARAGAPPPRGPRRAPWPWPPRAGSPPTRTSEAVAVTRDARELLDGLTVHIDSALEQVDRALLASWARAWNEVAVEWDAALADLAAASKDGKWPTPAKVRRAKRAQQAMRLALAAVQRAL